jgi:enoyl-[acyl-carrier protein] reductase I
VSIEDVGFAAAGLAGDNARLITGGTIHVDGGLHIIG